MDPFTMIPELANQLGIAPSTLVFWIVVVNVAARAITRRIPDDAVGFWGFVRQLTAILGAEVASRVTSGVTVKDVAKQALATPPITEKVAAAVGEDPAAITPVQPKEPN